MAINTATNDSVLKAGLSLVRMFRQQTSEMPMQQADVLLSIARRPGLTMAELAEETDLAQSSCSRNVAALSKYHRLGQEGLNFVETVIDPREPRRKLIFLTKEGKVFVTQLMRTLNEEFSYDKDTDARVEVAKMHEREMQRRRDDDVASRQEAARLRKGRVSVPS